MDPTVKVTHQVCSHCMRTVPFKEIVVRSEWGKPTFTGCRNCFNIHAQAQAGMTR